MIRKTLIWSRNIVISLIGLIILIKFGESVWWYFDYRTKFCKEILDDPCSLIDLQHDKIGRKNFLNSTFWNEEYGVFIINSLLYADGDFQGRSYLTRDRTYYRGSNGDPDTVIYKFLSTVEPTFNVEFWFHDYELVSLNVYEDGCLIDESSVLDKIRVDSLLCE